MPDFDGLTKSRQDRTFFIQGPGATNLLAQVRSSFFFSRDITGGVAHGANSESFRSNSFTRSTQLSFSPDGTRLDADIDAFNPNRLPYGMIFHGVEAFFHILGGVFGGGSKTNPYNVAFRSSWECK